MGRARHCGALHRLQGDALKLLDYHEATKHTLERLRRAPHTLDWANMPDPFRHFEGAPVLDLPADPVLDPALTGAQFLSSLFYYSCAISAAKVTASGNRYALRVNPSSGNLHPTEFHFVTRGIAGWPDGCYHYRPSSHMAEQRGRGDFLDGLSDAPLVVLLSSIYWREAWKYRDRAYRYVNLDLGHAWQALAYAAGALGFGIVVRGLFADREVSERFGLPGDEWPMLLLEIGAPRGKPGTAERTWDGGSPNQLSEETIPYASIEEMHAATIMDSTPAELPEQGLAVFPAKDCGTIARRRRSALDFEGGARTISREQLDALLDVTRRPMHKDWDGRFVRLFVFVHRVEGVEPGLYSFDPKSGRFDLRKAGDQRRIAASLSLGQSLAGNSVVTFSMIADLETAAVRYGDRAYRFVHHEAGAIGHRLYLMSEALGFRATGIGAFFDDEVHRWLDLAPSQGQVVYHLACGFPVRDGRLED